jgi:hypothetical protein
VAVRFPETNARFAEDEKEIVQSLLSSKSRFRMNAAATGWVGRAQKQLQELLRPILYAIKATFGHEVNIYLKHFAKVSADTDNRLNWDLRSNNCQQFSTTLLKGLLIDGVFHLLPKNFVDDPGSHAREKLAGPSLRGELWSAHRYADGVATPATSVHNL